MLLHSNPLRRLAQDSTKVHTQDGPVTYIGIDSYDPSVGEPRVVTSLTPSVGCTLAAENGRTVYNTPLLDFNISGLSINYNPPNASEQPLDGTLTDIIIRLGGNVLPITDTAIELICQASQEVMVPQVGPVTLITWGEHLPTDQDVNEPAPYADFLVRLYIRTNATRDYLLLAANQGAQIGDDNAAVFLTFLHFITRLADLGVQASVRMVGLTQVAGTFVASQYPLRPIARYDIQLGVSMQGMVPYNTSCATVILDRLRARAQGLFLTSVEVVSQTAPQMGAAQLQLRATVISCNLNATLAPCPYSPDVVLRQILMGDAFQQALLKDGMALSLNVTSITPSPGLVPPATSATDTSATPGSAPQLGGVPWHLDRLDQRALPLDGNYTADNLGTGVNIYLLSSGIRVSHEEFGYADGSHGARIKPAWGYNGSDPLVDCPDYIPWYGFGTYAASLMAGKTLGVAKNATVYSVRFRDKCLWMSPTIWGPGGLPSAMDAVLSNFVPPAVIMIDTWYMPTRLPFVDPDYVVGAITQRLDAAVARNITVVAPAGGGIGPGPCNNVIATHPGVLAVGSIDERDRRSLNSPVDSGNVSCIDIWAPGGGLGRTVVGAAASGDSDYIGVIPRGDTSPYIMTGVVAQYLSQHPTASPAQVKAALTAMATTGALTDIDNSLNLLAFTNMTQHAAADPTDVVLWPPPVRPPAHGATGTALSVGTTAGLVVGSVAAAVLLVAAIWLLVLHRLGHAHRHAMLSKGSSVPSKLVELNADFETSVDEIEICRRPDGSEWVLGVGQFGCVTKGIKNGVQVVAVKTLRTGMPQDPGLQEDFLREIAMMKFVSRDRNIVQYYGACIQPDRLMLVTEFMEGGDLRVALAKDYEAGELRWARQGKRIALDIARGVSFLHANNVSHRDLKSKNILLSREGCAKISDVGMAKMMTDGSVTFDAATGTFAWAAPELLLGSRCTEKVDIYSLGVVLWEIVTHDAPLRGEMRSPLVPDECPQELADLIEACMSQEPAARPSARQVYARLQACPHPLALEEIEPDYSLRQSSKETLRCHIADDSAEALSSNSAGPLRSPGNSGVAAGTPATCSSDDQGPLLRMRDARTETGSSGPPLSNSERERRLFDVPATPVDWRQAYGGGA